MLNLITGTTDLLRFTAALLSASICIFTQDAWADPPDEPLAIKAQGDFYVGGQVSFSHATRSDGIDLDPGEVMSDQTWVQYQIPELERGRWPIVMIHGAWHSGKTYLSTPDGREGWATYFVRQGFATYVVDDVRRGRSGYDPTQHNLVRLGLAEHATLEPLWRISNERAWTAFRIGPAPGVTYANSQFPSAAAKQYFSQLAPTYLGPEETQKRLAGLIGVLDKTGPAILVTHGSSGPVGWAAKEARPELVKGIVALEPPAKEAPADLDSLVDTPLLLIRGDFDSPLAVDQAKSFVDQLNAAGANSQFFSLPAIGITGNSHVMMMENNNLEIADIIIGWIDENLGMNNSTEVSKSVCDEQREDRPGLRCR